MSQLTTRKLQVGPYVGAVPRRLLPASWPIWAAFVMLPLWWALGVAGVAAIAIALPMLASLLFRRRLSAPKGFGIWLAFLLWCALSATQVDGPRQAFSLGYRMSLYVAATAFFLYVVNTPKHELPTSSVVRALGAFWVVAVVGGIVGMLLPGFSFTTPTQALLPRDLLDDRFIHDLVSASTTSLRAFAAYPIHRQKAPFAYTNEWGATFAVTLPFAIASLAYAKTKLSRDLKALLLIASVFPLVFSLDRGAWLSACGGLAYAALRLAKGRNAQLVKALAVGALAIGILMFVTPLGEIVATRLTNGYGDARRAELYRQSIELVRESPVFGHGAPVLVEGSISAGTHGQLWTVLVSQGVPGLVFFVGFLAWALWRASRKLPPGHPGDGHARLWCEVAILIAVLQSPYYDLLPWGLPIVMAAAGLAWREMREPLPAVAGRARPRA